MTRELQAAEGLLIRRGKGQRRTGEQVERPVRRFRTIGIGHRVADGQLHVGRTELREHRAVAVLDERMNDTLAVDDGIHLPQRQTVEPHGLDDLKALVHQRRGIDGDLRAHRPVGVTERVGARLARKLFAGKTIERPA